MASERLELIDSTIANPFFSYIVKFFERSHRMLKSQILYSNMAKINLSEVVTEVNDLRSQIFQKISIDPIKINLVSKYEPSRWSRSFITSRRSYRRLGTSDLKNFNAYGQSILNCTYKPNFDFLDTLRASEPLGDHVGGR